MQPSWIAWSEMQPIPVSDETSPARLSESLSSVASYQATFPLRHRSMQVPNVPVVSIRVSERPRYAVEHRLVITAIVSLSIIKYGG